MLRLTASLTPRPAGMDQLSRPGSTATPRCTSPTSSGFNKPGTRPLRTQTEVKDGCPSDCGLCPEHKQHACLGIIEANTGCNLDCPICFADSGSPRANGPDGCVLTLDQCATMLDVFVAAEGEPEVLMLSGGEPTIHPDILAMIDLAQQRPINAVNLNTNGVRLATDKHFVAELGRRNRPGRRLIIYLQFDGLEAETHFAVRGRDLRETKQKALDNCAEAGLTVTLVAASRRTSTSTRSDRSSGTGWPIPPSGRSPSSR